MPAVDAALVEDVRLDVKIEPTMIAEDSEAMVEAEVGKSSELSCEAEGYPIPKITWRKQDGTLLPNGKETVTGKLSIPDVKREHRGMYLIHNNDLLQNSIIDNRAKCSKFINIVQ